MFISRKASKPNPVSLSPQLISSPAMKKQTSARISQANHFILNPSFLLFQRTNEEKINAKEFPFINDYAKLIYDRTIQMGKKVAFVYKKEKTYDGSIELLQFASPTQYSKYKHAISHSIKKSFETNPPISVSYE